MGPGSRSNGGRRLSGWPQGAAAPPTLHCLPSPAGLRSPSLPSYGGRNEGSCESRAFGISSFRPFHFPFFFPVNWELPFLSLLSAYMSHFDLTSDKKGKKVFVIVFYVDNLRCAFLSSIKPLSLN